MKNTVLPGRALFVSVLLAGLLLSGPAASEQPFKLSYNSDWPPYSSGVGREVNGILPKLMTAIIGHRMGMKIVHRGYPWKRAQKVVETGQFDAFVTVPTKARLVYANSSNSVVYTIEMRPVVASGGAAEHKIGASPSPEVLKGLKLCEIIGNGWGKRFSEKNGLTPLMATKVASCLRMIANGRVEVTIQSPAVANRQIKAENLGRALSVLPNPYGVMKFTLLVSKKSAFGHKFITAFDKTMDAMTNDGTYQALVQRLVQGDLLPN